MNKANGLMKVCVLIVAIFVGSPIFSQVVFNETFDEGDDATTGDDDIGAVSWTTTCPDCIDDGDFFKIQGGALVGQDTNGPASFESGIIDISSCGFH